MRLRLIPIIFTLIFYGCASTTCKHTKRTTELQQSDYGLEKAEYENARKVDSIEIYDEFLTKYPASAWRDSVIYYRDRAALNKTKEIGTPEAFQEFLDKYPKSDWADQARYFKKYGVMK